MSSVESKVLYQIWTMYKQDIISLEQKGWLKDLLISGDSTLYHSVKGCDLPLMQSRLLEMIHFQGSPRDMDTDVISPNRPLYSNCSNTPKTTIVINQQRMNRYRFMSSGDGEIKEVLQKNRSYS